MELSVLILELSVLLAGAVFLGVLARRVGVQLTVVLALFGFLAGWLGGPLGIESPLRAESFEEVLVFLFLPVLVFEAALGLSTHSFMRNLTPILVLAVVAFVFSAGLVGVSLWLGLGIPLAAALVFGALISATDLVAVVAIFRDLGVPERLLTLVEGESMLNDGVAIVLFNVLLAAALALPGLDRLPAAALSVAVAYGGFVLAEGVLGFSGVTATVTSGLVLGGLAPSRASAEVRQLWDELWESLDYVANALLFLLIGLAIDPRLLWDNLGAVALAVVVVLLARAAAVLPIVSALQRLARIPPVGWRNESVLIWGGLRGGVALALALSLPESLAVRETFIAMTGGVVLATLLLNATTISWLVHRLGLDKPSRSDEFLAGVARLAGMRAARRRLDELGLQEPEISSRIEKAENSARGGLERIELTGEEEERVVIRCGLFAERESYQRLSDASLLPPPAARALLHGVEDQIEKFELDGSPAEIPERRTRSRFDHLVERLESRLPKPPGESAGEVVYAEASARRLATRRVGEELESFALLPNVKPSAVEKAREIFDVWEKQAVATLSRLDRGEEFVQEKFYRRQAEALGRIAALDALRGLTEAGLLSESLVDRTAEAVSAEIGQKTRAE